MAFFVLVVVCVVLLLILKERLPYTLNIFYFRKVCSFFFLKKKIFATQLLSQEKPMPSHLGLSDPSFFNVSRTEKDTWLGEMFSMKANGDIEMNRESQF